ncbi:hypothetical protein GCM10008967_20540 [Bacillus carboniphilus]|uniref:RNA polymerase sigma factor n=1 Tax=Bacillus carboniphilus TaxID=86663 RepID=A0ABP3FZJ4_9BACI
MSNKEIISQWFHEYSNDVYSFLVYYTGSTDVEDLVQEVFIKALKGLSTFKKEAQPKTWLIRIARNVAIDESRKRKSRAHHYSVPIHEWQEQGHELTPELMVDQQETKATLYQMIQSLKSNDRDVLILRGIKQLSVAETATILKWTESKVRSTYHRALQKLRKLQGGIQ